MGRDRADDSLKSERMVALSQATKPVAYVYNLPFVCLCVCVCVCVLGETRDWAFGRSSCGRQDKCRSNPYLK